MNDWYNDPPDYDDPYCPDCGGYGEYCDGEEPDTYCCMDCGHVFVLPPDPDIQPDDPMTDEDLEEQVQAQYEANRLCPHGREWSECDACMVAGDLACDAARESRLKR